MQDEQLKRRVSNLESEMRKMKEEMKMVKGENQKLRSELTRIAEGYNVFQAFMNERASEKLRVDKLEMDEILRKENEERIRSHKIAERKALFTKILNQNQIDALGKIIDFNRNWKLLFRASFDGFRGSDFHRKCNNVEGTLVVVKTEQGNVLGGWNPTKWNKVNNKYCDAKGAFLFGFVDHVILQKIDYNQNGLAIGCYSQCGPIFGAGHDLRIGNGCNKVANSTVNLRGSYPDKGLGKHCLNGGKEFFKVVEYEVFSL